MRPWGSYDLEAPLLRKMVGRPAEIRSTHEAFLDRSAGQFATWVADSRQLLRQAGAADERNRRPAGPGAQARLLPATTPPVAGQVAKQSQANVGDRTATDIMTVLDGGKIYAEPRMNPVVEAVFCPPEPALEPEARVISTRGFQRGHGVVAPAPCLSYAGPGALSPGERRRAAGLAAGAGKGLYEPLVGEDASRLADGVSGMLHPVPLKLGDLRTKPTAHCSAVENLIVRLVEHPEECFADPLALVQGARGMKVRGLEI